MSPVADSVVQRLDAARQKWWIFSLLSTCVLALCASLATLLACMLLDALVQFSQVVLAGMLLAWLGVSTTLIVVITRRLMRGQRSLEATARRVEAELPELGSNLINVVQLSQDGVNGSHWFREAAVKEAAARVGHASFDEAASRESRWRRFRYCMQTPRDLMESFLGLGTLVAIGVLCSMLLPGWGSAASRLLKPWQFVPAVGSVGAIKVTPGSTEVLVGASLQVTAEINDPEGKPYNAVLFSATGDEAEQELPMMPADESRKKYLFTLPSVLKPLRYRVEIGDSQSAVFQVGVREKPAVDEVEVTYRFPAYLGRSSETFVQRHADLEAPVGTEAELRIRASSPIAKGRVEMGTAVYTGRVEDDGRLVVGFPLKEDGVFTVHLVNSAGHGDPTPRPNQIRVITDQPPTVELLKPPRQSTEAPGASVPVMIRAIDDHAVGRLRLEMKVVTESAATAGDSTDETSAPPVSGSAVVEVIPVTTVQQWTDIQAGSVCVEHYRLELPAERFQAGHTVMVRAVAWDRRNIAKWGLDLMPQEAASAWHAIRLVDSQARTTETLEQLDSVRTGIYRILEKQIRARVQSASILKEEAVAERLGVAESVRKGQVDIQKDAIALVKAMGNSEAPDKAAVRRVMNSLSFGDMLSAVQLCDHLVKLDIAGAFAQPIPDLLGVQDRIIDVLRKLLDVARQAQNEVLKETDRRVGGELPSDVERKLEDLRKKLDEFAEQQKKVVEATENLAKKPVEDFTEEDEQLLIGLAASQDDWAKMMEEFHSDLSKLPDQDFANPALLKELVEIQTELKMAEDALLKKTADIAVPLEQLGAEMAEEIKTNLEKWLPDTPDRERWSQEEGLTDMEKEAPMAELPGELEDLIGELMEEEEDLFDEMEDVSSSAADSLDKGAGWDVADGPISNMSAKGATGNRLPNTSEIGGRAGEGRQGKSSGEFVGDEAVGKGGRNTPARLTPDPYVKGQIKDHSKDGTGGATGGGKESGQGGEGLEGPMPGAPGKRDLERLAGKQATLRNKAEGVDVQLEIMNFHRTDMEKMLKLMAQVERDLRAGRYQSALRQRQVMAEGLGSMKRYLEGEFEVRQDATANLPGDIQKELLGSMQDPSPAGWEELNRHYFERLSDGEGAAVEKAQDP